MAREHYLRPEIEAPDLTIITYFIRFYAATSDPRINKEVSTDEFLRILDEFLGTMSSPGTGWQVPRTEPIVPRNRCEIPRNGCDIPRNSSSIPRNDRKRDARQDT